MRQRSLVRAVVSLALLGALVPVGAARAATLSGPRAACAKSMATNLYTFEVEAKPKKKSYRAGTTVKVDMRVTRPGTRDPMGGTTEIPRVVDLPASDVDVSVSVYAGMYYMYGVGVTDENGEATVSVRLHRNAPAGWIRADVSARTYYNRGGCPDIEELGFESYERFFKITR